MVERPRALPLRPHPGAVLAWSLQYATDASRAERKAKAMPLSCQPRAMNTTYRGSVVLRCI